MLALLAALPILAMLITLGALRWRAHHAALTAWAFGFVLAATAFGMPVVQAMSTSLQGVAYGIFPLLWILVTAIWMYEVTVASGRFDDLRRTFFLISDDPRILGLLIAFCFGGLLEALSGFGAPVAIATAMLLAIGFGPLRAALVALLANTVPVAFGGVGIPILVAAQTAGIDDVLAISPIAGRLTALLSLLIPFLLLAVMDGMRAVRQCWPMGLAIGLTFAVSKWIVSGTPLYPLTEVVASVASVGVALLLLRIWRPKGAAAAVARVGRHVEPELESSVAALPPAATDGPALTPRRIGMALVPYGLIIVVFGIATLPPIRALLVSLDLRFNWPFLSDLMAPGGGASPHQNFTLAWASTPGLLLAVVAITTGLIYRLALSRIFAVLWVTVKRLRHTALTIGAVVALAYVMGDSGQTWELGLLVAGSGVVYPFLAPVLGWLGTYVTGSDTSANILFSKLQADVGAQLGAGSHLGTEGLQHLLVGANATGGVVGKMISPQSLAIAATAIRIPGAESAILRRTLGWSIGLLAVLCLLAGLMSTPALSWLLP